MVPEYDKHEEMIYMDKKLDILADEMLEGVAGGVGTGEEAAGMQMDPQDQKEKQDQHTAPTPA